MIVRSNATVSVALAFASIRRWSNSVIVSGLHGLPRHSSIHVTTAVGKDFPIASGDAGSPAPRNGAAAIGTGRTAGAGFVASVDDVGLLD
jgi:hypothetical protein